MPDGSLTTVFERPRGSIATADAATGDTVINVEDPTDFDDSGTIQLGNQVGAVQVTYDAIDDDTGDITLSAPLAVAIDTGDPILILAGGELAIDRLGEVDLGDGDNIEVALPFAYRALLQIGIQDPPRKVVVADDLSEITDLPGQQGAIIPDVVQGLLIEGGTLTTSLDRTVPRIVITEGDSGPQIQLWSGTETGDTPDAAISWEADPVAGQRLEIDAGADVQIGAPSYDWPETASQPAGNAVRIDADTYLDARGPVVAPQAFQSGIVTVNPAGAGPYAGSVDVTFDAFGWLGGFPIAPVVVATPQSTVPGNVSVSTHSEHAGGFTIELSRTDSATPTNVHWIAMYPTQS